MVEPEQTFAIMNEMSMAITKSGEQTPFELANKIQKDGDVYETIYPSSLFSPTGKASNSGVNCIVEELINNTEQYPYTKRFLYKTATKSTDGLYSLPIEIYMPYSHSFNVEEEDYITVACQRPETDEWTDGYVYSRTGEKKYVPLIDENYIKNNMTLLILPADTTAYSTPMSEDEINSHLDKESILLTKSGLPDGLITSNITNSANIDENDVLLSTVAAIRVKDSSWCGAISNKLKLAIYRASGDLEFNSDGSLKPSASCHKPFLIAIGKDQIRNKVWIDGNYLFDDDWDLHEYDQKIFFISEHNIVLKCGTGTAKVTIGYKDGKPSIEAGATASVEASFTGGILRQHNQFTRKSMLSNINNDIGSGLHDGHTIFSYGNVDMVFHYYYTNIL